MQIISKNITQLTIYIYWVIIQISHPGNGQLCNVLTNNLKCGPVAEWFNVPVHTGNDSKGRGKLPGVGKVENLILCHYTTW